MLGMSKIRIAVGEPSRDKRYLINVVWQHDDVIPIKSNNVAHCIDAAADNALRIMEKHCDVERGKYYWQWSIEVNGKFVIHSLPEVW